MSGYNISLKASAFGQNMFVLIAAIGPAGRYCNYHVVCIGGLWETERLKAAESDLS